MILLGLIMIALGLSIHVLKLYFLVIGYSTLSVEKKAYVDIRSMAKFMGLVYYFDGALLIFSDLMALKGVLISPVAIAVIIVVSIIFMLFFVQRYNGNLFDEEHKIQKEALRQIMIPMTLAILFLISLLIAVILII